MESSSGGIICGDGRLSEGVTIYVRPEGVDIFVDHVDLGSMQLMGT